MLLNLHLLHRVCTQLHLADDDGLQGQEAERGEGEGDAAEEEDQVRERFESVFSQNGKRGVGGGGVGSAAVGGEEEDLDLARGVGCAGCV